MKLWKWWDQLPADVQKALLVTLVVMGGTSVSCRLSGPVICDPAPPPSTTPMICDPPPPPPITATPMICDPAPPPPTPYPTVTLAPGQHFTAHVIDTRLDPGISGALIQGAVFDQDGRPLPGISLVISGEGGEARTVTDQNGSFALTVPQAGTYRLSVEGDEDNALTVTLSPNAIITVNWQESWDESHAPLPLAEVRSVRIDWQGGLTFAARSPWPGATCRWTATGGTLIDEGDRVTWQPPAKPGRYMLQVIADWGWRGLAADALTLTVGQDGLVHLG